MSQIRKTIFRRPLPKHRTAAVKPVLPSKSQAVPVAPERANAQVKPVANVPHPETVMELQQLREAIKKQELRIDASEHKQLQQEEQLRRISAEIQDINGMMQDWRRSLQEVTAKIDVEMTDLV